MRLTDDTPSHFPDPAPSEAPVRNAAPSNATGKATEAAEKFESFFISQMLAQARKNTKVIAGEDSIYNSHENEDMLDLANTFVADALAKQHAFGIADLILRQVLPKKSSETMQGDHSDLLNHSSKI
jgi:flagellar protein FlgJ